MNKIKLSSVRGKLILFLICILLVACSRGRWGVYHNPNMDFAAIKTVAVMPFQNLTSDKSAADRVRDVFTNILMSYGEMYAIPPGEVARGALRAGITTPETPATEEIIKLAAITKVDAVITGVVREYGEVKAGTASSNIISFSLQMIETQSGKVIWSASTTMGGIRLKDRLFGSGGVPMNYITEKAVYDIIKKYFM